MRRTRLTTVVALLALVGTPSLLASRQETTFKSRVEAVRLDVSVTRGGRPVGGLTAADFAVSDNNVPQQVAVQVDPLPLSVLLVLDTSGSVEGERLSHLVKAVSELVTSLHAGDRAALITFSGDVMVRVPLTTTGEQLTSILNSLVARGQTAIRDAVFTALQLTPEDDSRPLVLVFSDGRDNASWLSISDTLTAARRAGVVIHAVTVAEEKRADLVQPGSPAPSVQRDTASTFIERLVDATGGRQWQAAASADLRPLLMRALDEMRARYLLTFYPENVKREGWHDLKVTLKRTSGDVTTRPGYFVPSPN